MDVAAAEELRLCHAASVAEAMLATGGGRRFNAEAFQRVLWRHREEIMGLVKDIDSTDQLVGDLRRALRPFARCEPILPPAQNPVLLSVPAPGDGGRSFIQLRSDDFRLAAALTGAKP
tara:strand:- start:443 stop:796 length:354 start_codon:yes stop_codon:yes gene_type:complete